MSAIHISVWARLLPFMRAEEDDPLLPGGSRRARRTKESSAYTRGKRDGPGVSHFVTDALGILQLPFLVHWMHTGELLSFATLSVLSWESIVHRCCTESVTSILLSYPVF